ncbi:hypothetical protein C8J35_1651, partial [Rhizobium sp. PP-F2F-G38]
MICFSIWLFRERLVRAGAIDNLFARFDKHCRGSGYLAKGGQIINATIIQASKRHNNQDEKAAIKASEIPPEWKDKPAKLAQRDRDARWTMKYSKAKQPIGSWSSSYAIRLRPHRSGRADFPHPALPESNPR